MKVRMRLIDIEKDTEEIRCPKCNSKYINWENLQCKSCKYRLGTKDIMKKVPIVETMQYGFWLRFVSEHFIPCDECQEVLDDMIKKSKIALYDPHCITLEEYPEKGNWRFLLRFLDNNKDVFTPCKGCQSKILRGLDEKEIHIGNDGKPLVELWRKWDIDDKKTQELEKKLKGKALKPEEYQEILNNFRGWKPDKKITMKITKGQDYRNT